MISFNFHTLLTDQIKSIIHLIGIISKKSCHIKLDMLSCFESLVFHVYHNKK